MTYSLILLVVWIAVLLLASRHFIYIALIGFPGTFLHEIMHFLVGTLLFAKPVSCNLLPYRTANRWQFGSVSFAGLNLLNAAPVAYAPLLLMGVAWALFHYWMVPSILAKHYLEWVLSGYLTACAVVYSVPSATDIKVGGWSTLFWGSAGLIVWWVWTKSGLIG